MKVSLGRKTLILPSPFRYPYGSQPPTYPPREAFWRLPFESRSWMTRPSNSANEAMMFLNNWPVAVAVSTPSRRKTVSTPWSRSVRSISITSLTDRPARSIDGKTTTLNRPAFTSARSRSSAGRSFL